MAAPAQGVQDHGQVDVAVAGHHHVATSAARARASGGAPATVTTIGRVDRVQRVREQPSHRRSALLPQGVLDPVQDAAPEGVDAGRVEGAGPVAVADGQGVLDRRPVVDPGQGPGAGVVL